MLPLPTASGSVLGSRFTNGLMSILGLRLRLSPMLDLSISLTLSLTQRKLQSVNSEFTKGLKTILMQVKTYGISHTLAYGFIKGPGPMLDISFGLPLSLTKTDLSLPI